MLHKPPFLYIILQHLLLFIIMVCDAAKYYILKKPDHHFNHPVSHHPWLTNVNYYSLKKRNYYSPGKMYYFLLNYK